MTHTDFAYLPFGAGGRKCVGDQFACLEAAITLAMMVRHFDVSLATRPEDVGMYTGATIHTRNGLKMFVKRRDFGSKKVEETSLDNDSSMLIGA